MSKTIYLIASGQYSDYGVYAAYLTEEEAKTARDAMNEVLDSYEECFIETIELSPELPKFKEGFNWWNVNFRDGKWTAHEGNSVYRISQTNNVSTGTPVGGTPWYSVSVIADTQERALKAGNERIMQFIASNP